MSSPEADLLKVAPDAGLDEIKKAYRKAALAHHPDQNPDPHAARHFRRLTEAYRILSDRAAQREPRVPRRAPSPSERLGFLLADLAALVRRWPADRWGRVTDGLPAAVWVAGTLDVVSKAWPGGPEASPVVPTAEGIAAALARWQGYPKEVPVLTKAETRALETMLGAAEQRIRALDRPRRSPR